MLKLPTGQQRAARLRLKVLQLVAVLQTRRPKHNQQPSLQSLLHRDLQILLPRAVIRQKNSLSAPKLHHRQLLKRAPSLQAQGRQTKPVRRQHRSQGRNKRERRPQANRRQVHPGRQQRKSRCQRMCPSSLRRLQTLLIRKNLMPFLPGRRLLLPRNNCRSRLLRTHHLANHPLTVSPILRLSMQSRHLFRMISHLRQARKIIQSQRPQTHRSH